MPVIRDGHGRFSDSPETANRDAKAATLRAQGRTFQQIATELGYSDRGDAWRGVQRARASVLQGPAEELIRTEAAQLDILYTEALEVLERDHVMVSHGRIICDDNGDPILDDGPKLAAIRELRTLRESYRKLFGLDAATKTEVSGGVRYEVVGIDPADLT